MSRKEDRTIDFTQTGMISAKSIPNGANVYLNGVLLTATDDTISGIEPGIHNLKIVKKGFVTWTKDIEVFPELVTDVTSVLVSQSPRLEPLTNTGARTPTISPTLSKLAYFSKEPESSGIRVITLAQEGISLFRSTPSTILSDTPRIAYSNGLSLEWSPDEKELLVEVEKDVFYVVDLENNSAIIVKDPVVTRTAWTEELTKKRADFLQKVEIPEDIRKLATDQKSVWAPDGRKFLYTVINAGNIEYRVYNMEQPIPVGEQVENVTLTIKQTDPQPKVSWFADSFHLIVTQGYTETDKKGVISLIRIDGTNMTELYNNTLYSDQVYSAPSGDKIIMLTSFKSGEQTDLYTISIRD